MEYTKEIEKIYNDVPEKYHGKLRKLSKYYRELGIKEIQQLMQEVTNIPSDKINEFGVYHDSDIEGG